MVARVQGEEDHNLHQENWESQSIIPETKSIVIKHMSKSRSSTELKERSSIDIKPSIQLEKDYNC